MDTVKKIPSCQVFGMGRDKQAAVQRIFLGSENPLCGIIMTVHHYTFVETQRTYKTKSEP